MRKMGEKTMISSEKTLCIKCVRTHDFSGSVIGKTALLMYNLCNVYNIHNIYLNLTQRKDLLKRPFTYFIHNSSSSSSSSSSNSLRTYGKFTYVNLTQRGENGR